MPSQRWTKFEDGAGAMADELRRVLIYISPNTSSYDALLDLQSHLKEYNHRFGTSWSMTAPKRGRLGEVVGKASDGNHLLYRCHLDAILAEVAKPITVEAIRQKLLDLGEKPSTAKLLSGDYMKLITKVLNPSTKRHRGAEKSLTAWGVE